MSLNIIHEYFPFSRNVIFVSGDFFLSRLTSVKQLLYVGTLKRRRVETGIRALYM